MVIRLRMCTPGGSNHSSVKENWQDRALKIWISVQIEHLRNSVRCRIPCKYQKTSGPFVSNKTRMSSKRYFLRIWWPKSFAFFFFFCNRRFRDFFLLHPSFVHHEYDKTTNALSQKYALTCRFSFAVSTSLTNEPYHILFSESTTNTFVGHDLKKCAAPYHVPRSFQSLLINVTMWEEWVNTGTF